MKLKFWSSKDISRLTGEDVFGLLLHYKRHNNRLTQRLLMRIWLTVGYHRGFISPRYRGSSINMRFWTRIARLHGVTPIIVIKRFFNEQIILLRRLYYQLRAIRYSCFKKRWTTLNVKLTSTPNSRDTTSTLRYPGGRVVTNQTRFNRVKQHPTHAWWPTPLYGNNKFSNQSKPRYLFNSKNPRYPRLRSTQKKVHYSSSNKFIYSNTRRPSGYLSYTDRHILKMCKRRSLSFGPSHVVRRSHYFYALWVWSNKRKRRISKQTTRTALTLVSKYKNLNLTLPYRFRLWSSLFPAIAPQHATNSSKCIKNPLYAKVKRYKARKQASIIIYSGNRGFLKMKKVRRFRFSLRREAPSTPGRFRNFIWQAFPFSRRRTLGLVKPPLYLQDLLSFRFILLFGLQRFLSAKKTRVNSKGRGKSTLFHLYRGLRSQGGAAQQTFVTSVEFQLVNTLLRASIVVSPYFAEQVARYGAFLVNGNPIKTTLTSVFHWDIITVSNKSWWLIYSYLYSHYLIYSKRVKLTAKSLKFQRRKPRLRSYRGIFVTKNFASAVKKKRKFNKQKHTALLGAPYNAFSWKLQTYFGIPKRVRWQALYAKNFWLYNTLSRKIPFVLPAPPYMEISYKLLTFILIHTVRADKMRNPGFSLQDFTRLASIHSDRTILGL